MGRTNEDYEAALRLAEDGWEACEIYAPAAGRASDLAKIRKIRGQLILLREMHQIITAQASDG
jgi:hypothetical protein